MCRQKRVRFPKGKKIKTGETVVDEQHDKVIPDKLADPQSAALERAKRRSEIAEEMFDDDNRGIIHDISRAEVQYEVNILNLRTIILFVCFGRGEGSQCRSNFSVFVVQK